MAYGIYDDYLRLACPLCERAYVDTAAESRCQACAETPFLALYYNDLIVMRGPVPLAAVEAWRRVSFQTRFQMAGTLSRQFDATSEHVGVATLDLLRKLEAAGVRCWWVYLNISQVVGLLSHADVQVTLWYRARPIRGREYQDAGRVHQVTLDDIGMPRLRLWTVADAMTWYTLWDDEELTYESWLEQFDEEDSDKNQADYARYARNYRDLGALLEAASDDSGIDLLAALEEVQ